MKLLLGHGASGTATSMQPWVEALASHGMEGIALTHPRGGRSQATVDVFRSALLEHLDAAIGGHSFGGRMASLLAAEQSVAALVLLSYPLHRPGHPEQLRTDHWPKITCPVLLLSGESDPFATIALLRKSVDLLRHPELVTYPRIGHGLLSVVGDAASRIAAFLAAIV